MASTLELLILAQIAEPAWTAMSFANSWSNFGSLAAAQYRLWPLSNELEVIGTVSHASISGASQFCATFTGVNVPASEQRGMAMEIALSGQPNVQLRYLPSGVMSFSGLPATSTAVAFHWFFSLDA